MRPRLSYFPEKVFRIKVGKITFWTPANSKHHARRLVHSLADDMKQSVKLRNAWEITPGHIGLGNAGIAMARRKGTRK